jgi:hypothetical protein
VAERREMNYKIWFDEGAGAAYLKVINMLNADDVHGILPGLNKLLEGKDHRYVVVDVTDNPPGLLDQPARKAFKSYAKKIDFDKIAMFGAKPFIRMLAKAAVMALGKFDITKFFEAEDEALAWLKGKEEK